MEETQKQPPLVPRMRLWLVRRHILHQNSNVTNATAEFLWERVERLLDYLDEMCTLHPSPTEINKGTLTPSSHLRLCRHHRHLLCRRLRLPLRLLPRLALGEGGHRRLPTDQKGQSRGILDVFCSCPMVRSPQHGHSSTQDYPDGRTSADLASDTGAGKRQPAPTAQGSPDRDGLGEFPPPSVHRRSAETSRKLQRFRR